MLTCHYLDEDDDDEELPALEGADDDDVEEVPASTSKPAAKITEVK